MTGTKHNGSGSFLPTEDGEFNGNLPDEMSITPRLLEIKPGDRFVINLDCHASNEVIERVHKMWRTFAGDEAKILVLDKGVELSVLRGHPASDGGVIRSELLQRISSALDDLSPDDTIGFSNGAQWIDVATVAEIRKAAYPSPKTNVVPADLRDLTFAIQHNPRCPSPWLVRLVGKSGTIDMMPYGDPIGFVKHQTTDRLGFGKTLEEAARAALATTEDTA